MKSEPSATLRDYRHTDSCTSPATYSYGLDQDAIVHHNIALRLTRLGVFVRSDADGGGIRSDSSPDRDHGVRGGGIFAQRFGSESWQDRLGI